MSRFVEVAVQLPVHGTYHYGVPAFCAGEALVGRRVLVPFGSRGVTGVVVGTSEEAPGEVEVRDLEALLDLEPALGADLVELCKWISSYYEAPLGEVIRAALPAGTRVHAASRVELTPEGRAALEGEGGALARGAREVLGALAAGKALKGGQRKAVEELAAAGMVMMVRDVGRARVRDKVVRVAVLVRPEDAPRSREEREEDPSRPSRLRGSPRQDAVLDAIRAAGGEIEVSKLKASAHVRALVKKGVVEIQERVVRGDAWAGRADDAAGMVAPVEAPELTEAQASAVATVREGLEAGEFRGYLLHGITGSGKTEVYLHVIAEVLAKGMGAMVLVPEISLTPQLAARFRARFGDLVAVLHSGLTDRERFDEWNRLKEGRARIALGARSAVFAPVPELGAIVVDEEHDGSFKQEEGVRYQARDVALVRAQRARAVCVLGSATPSMESMYGAECGRLALLGLPERAAARPLPEVTLVDLRDYRPDPDSLLTAPLGAAIEETLAKGEQAILFLNRRGFNTFVLCVRCGHAFRCNACSVSLTYHKHSDRLKCHYCGHGERVPEVCPACEATGSITRRGLGTERIAAALAERFPQARVARLDRDAAVGPQVEKILGRMARGEIDLLVGTQMVAKGHDFPGVTLVGVLLADTGLSLPDFRAGERTFQLLTQVAGRAGRGDKPGRVIIQSYRVDAVPVAAAVGHDYARFYQSELEARRELDYPPFGHLAALRLDGPDERAVERAAAQLADRARALGSARGVTVLGPSEAPLARLKGRTRWHMWLRARDRRDLRGFLRQLAPVAAAAPLPGVRLTVDVDPVSAL
ncbi:MAG TPA: primosomal protein N' [Kofleriaceae bacterium]|nr:primosomal protein N' [Kofleriaceae bacterium]